MPRNLGLGGETSSRFGNGGGYGIGLWRVAKQIVEADVRALRNSQRSRVRWGDADHV